MMEIDRIVCADALTYLAGLPSASVDMCLVDLPYGSTELAWDLVIPLDPLWEQFKRVSKPRSAIVLTASQPFTSTLVMSNLSMFNHEWIWEKSSGGGFLNANKQPLKRHENILVFCDASGAYTPQRSSGKPYKAKRGGAALQVVNGGRANIVGHETINDGWRYPTTVLRFANETGIHPTQKPVALFEYLIRTYTQAGDVVLDCCMGSGTTAVAARQCGRHFVGCDSSPEYVHLARERLAQPWQPQLAGFA
jgi:site-specific DNA-methyltransferase (adenine-specific)